MATYCISDLHGRFDLFQMLLEKIKFDPSCDKMYILGDVIDRNYGGIKILQYLIAHQNACFLIEGNHESQFTYMCKAYDVVMFNPRIKEAMSKAVAVYSDSLFHPISQSFFNCLATKKAQSFYSNRNIKKWSNEGDKKVRQRLLDTMIYLAGSLDYDEALYRQAAWILSNLKGQFKTKAFVQELLEQTPETYVQIKKYLKHLPDRLDFQLNGTQFVLSHWKGQINKNVSYKIQHPHATTQRITYIFGHDPIPILHSKIQSNTNYFNFDYRQIYAWMDTVQNRYYWLDLGSNPIVAIKLDDMSEYYVGLPSTKKNATPWTVPPNTTPVPGKTYRYVENAGLCGAPSFKVAIVTLDSGCYEFLIGITKKNKIYYTHVGWLECQCSFIVDDPFTNQPLEEIIEIVRQDFSKVLVASENQFIIDAFHGIKRVPQ